MKLADIKVGETYAVGTASDVKTGWRQYDSVLVLSVDPWTKVDTWSATTIKPGKTPTGTLARRAVNGVAVAKLARWNNGTPEWRPDVIALNRIVCTVAEAEGHRAARDEQDRIIRKERDQRAELNAKLAEQIRTDAELAGLDLGDIPDLGSTVEIDKLTLLNLIQRLHDAEAN